MMVGDGGGSMSWVDKIGMVAIGDGRLMKDVGDGKGLSLVTSHGGIR